MQFGSHGRGRRRRRDPRDRAHERDADEAEDDQRGARVSRQPDQRHAATVGKQRRLARLDRQPVADDLAEARGHARGEIAGAHGGAGRHDDDVVLRDGLAEHAFELGRLVGNDAAQHRLAARLADEARQRGGAGITHLAGRRCPGARRHDLVTGRDDAHAGRDVGGELGDAGRGEQPEIGSAERAARRREDVAGRGLLAGLQDAVARGDAAQDLDMARHRVARVLDHHDGVRSARDQPAGRDLQRRARADLAFRSAAHHHGAGDLEQRRQGLAGGVRVGRPDGVAVDGCARPARQLLAGRGRPRPARRRAPEPPGRPRCAGWPRAP